MEKNINPFPIEILGQTNLFTDDFIYGTELGNPYISNVDIAISWGNKKDKVFGTNEKYSTNQTDFSSFPHIIPIPTFKKILDNLAQIYREKYPYSEKENFINHVFGYSLYSLGKFIDYSFGNLNLQPKEHLIAFTHLEPLVLTCEDYFIKDSENIENYRQYFKKIISLITEFDFDKNQSEKKKPKPSKKIKRTEQKIIALTHIYNNTPITAKNRATIAIQYGYNSPNSGQKLQTLYQQFKDVDKRTTANEISKRANSALKTLLKNTIALLKGTAKQKAEKELETLLSNIKEKKEYP